MFFSDMPQFNNRKEKIALPVRLKHTCPVCLERISLFIPGHASLTVEAACILPLFLYAVLAVMYFFAAVGISGAISAGILETGKELAVYAYAQQTLGINAGSEISQLVMGNLSTAYAKGKIIEKINETGVDTTVLKNGADGIHLSGSSFLEKEDIIDLRVNYRLKFPIAVFALKEIPVIQRGYFRAWTGREGSLYNTDSESSDNEVYVTVNGSVYHKDKNCTHIRLSIKKVDKNSIGKLRNESGGKYYPCESCKGGHGAEVYITETGDRYHGSVSCSGLKRQIMKVQLTQVEGWPSCSRCGG